MLFATYTFIHNHLYWYENFALFPYKNASLWCQTDFGSLTNQTRKFNQLRMEDSEVWMIFLKIFLKLKLQHTRGIEQSRLLSVRRFSKSMNELIPAKAVSIVSFQLKLFKVIDDNSFKALLSERDGLKHKGTVFILQNFIC